MRKNILQQLSLMNVNLCTVFLTLLVTVNNALGQTSDIIFKNSLELSQNTQPYVWLGKPLDYSGSFELSFLIATDQLTVIDLSLETTQKFNGRLMRIFLGPNKGYNQAIKFTTNLYTYVYDISGFDEVLQDGKFHRVTVRVIKDSSEFYFFDLIIDGKLQRRYDILRERGNDNRFDQIVAAESNEGIFKLSAYGEGLVKLTEVTYRKLSDKKNFLSLTAFGESREINEKKYKGAVFVQLISKNGNKVDHKAFGYYPTSQAISSFNVLPVSTELTYSPIPFEDSPDWISTFKVEITPEEYNSIFVVLENWLKEPKRKPFNLKNSGELVDKVLSIPISSIASNSEYVPISDALSTVEALSGSSTNDNGHLYRLNFDKIEASIGLVNYCEKYELQDDYPCPCPPNHDYALATVVCSPKDNPYCTVTNVFNFMISNIEYMAPASIRAITYPTRIWDFGDARTNSLSAQPITPRMYYITPNPNPTVVNDPDNAEQINQPEKFRTKQEVLERRNQGNRVCDCKETMLIGWDIKKLEKWSGFFNVFNPFDGFTIKRDNPIFNKVYPQQHTAVNYTVLGHVLYPGKVTRQVVEENGQVIIKTRGVGSTPLYETNIKVGRIFFARIDNNLWLDFNTVANSPELQKLVSDQPCQSNSIISVPTIKK